MFQGFTGRLNAQGRANAGIVIPPVPGLRGGRFFVSFVTLGPGGVAIIANTAGFTIR
jgi:hypothetical protein